jgi:hypothetical protein
VTTRDAARSPGSRRVSLFVGAAAVGWFVVYNAMRLAGSAPADAAWPSLLIGGVAGLAIMGAALAAVPGLRPERRTPVAARMPVPEAIDARGRALLRAAAVAFGALAVVALAMAGALAVDWVGTSADDRAATSLVVAGWNVLAGFWLGDEALRFRRGHADGLDTAVLGAVLTAVLAGVAIARDLLVPGQAVVIALAGIAGGIGGFAAWRLLGGRGVPVIAALAVAAAVLALVVPLA